MGQDSAKPVKTFAKFPVAAQTFTFTNVLVVLLVPSETENEIARSTVLGFGNELLNFTVLKIC
jgi:hypothetical protein